MSTYDTYRWGSMGYTGPSPLRRSKLTPLQRQEIGFLKFEGSDVKELALQFGVSAATVRNISPLERPHGQ